MTTNDEPFRIGGVPYLVGAPLLHGLAGDPAVDLVRDRPRRLVDGLRSGRYEAALVSSIEGFRTPGYAALPDLGIACDDEVRSVRAFLACPPARVRSLAVDDGSETSVALCRILLERRFGAALERCVRIEPTLRPDEVEADAVLLIGDAGLRAEPGPRDVLDLGHAWREWKDLPFVFALWLLNAEGPRAARLAALLRRSHEAGRAAGVEDGTGGSIRYALTEAHRAGLAAFHAEAAAAGLCDSALAPAWIEVEDPSRSHASRQPEG
ncbi:MAG: MqnA/MqnD/SBP family protein [Planctomycetota bacterium]